MSAMIQALLESIHLVLGYFQELGMEESFARLLYDVISQYSQLTISLTPHCVFVSSRYTAWFYQHSPRS